MSGKSFLGTSRRQFLASAAALAGSGALAGCSAGDVIDQEFEATPVGLPEDGRAELAMAESFADSLTVTREGSAMGVEGEVTVTNYVAGYGRDVTALDEASEYRPTLIESFVEVGNGVGRAANPENGTNGAYYGRVASVATAVDVGIDEVTLDVFEEAPTVPGDAVSLVVPEGVRGGQDGETATPLQDSLVLMYPPETSPELTLRTGGFEIPATEFFPSPGWNPADGGEAFTTYESPTWLSRWLGGDVPDGTEFVESGRVLLPLGDHTPEEVFGIPAGEIPGEQIEEGDSFTGNNPFLLAAPGTVAVGGQSPFTVEALFDAARPAPMGGTNFGLGVLSTPNEQLGGQSVSPLAEMDLEQLLTSDQARRMVDDIDGTTDEVEWVTGPERVAVGGQSPFTILDEDAELETFAGVTTGANGPWFTLVHLARVAAEDVVIAAGSYSTPLGTTDPVAQDDGIGSFAEDDGISHFVEDGARFSGVAGERLRPGVPDNDG